MSADFTTVGLVQKVQRRGFLPAGGALKTGDILEYATEQLRNYIPAFLKDLREEYLISTLTLAITGPVVAAPARAVGAALRTLKWKGSDGRLVPVARTEPERAGDFCLTGSCPQAYYFEGNNLVLLPAVTSGTLVLGYQQRPGQLVLPSDCAKLTALEDSFTWDVTAVPSTMAHGTVVDIVSGAVGDNFKLRAMDLVIDSVTPTTIAFTNALPTTLQAGDYVCLAEETCIPQLPIELHDLIAQAAAAAIANATGSSRKDSINAALLELRAQLTTLLTPRNDGSARVIVNRSSIGWRRGY